MLSITDLATNADLNDVKNKIPNVTDLVIKPDDDAKRKNVEDKYFSTSIYNKFTNQILTAKIKNVELLHKSDISEFIKNTDLDKLTTKAELEAQQGKIVELQTHDSSLFIGQCYFINDVSKNFLIYQTIFGFFAVPASHVDAAIDKSMKI